MMGDVDGTDRLAQLQGELEQAKVAMEDMDARLAELAGANATLESQLETQLCLRVKAEQRVVELLADASKQSTQREEVALRQELSVALEELQVMQEELQTAHDALAAAQRSA